MNASIPRKQFCMALNSYKIFWSCMKTAIRITSPDSYYSNRTPKQLQPELLYFLQSNFLQWIHILLLSTSDSYPTITSAHHNCL